MKKKKIQNFVLHLNEELGTGSFGKVFKGINQQNKEVVAIKVLSKKQIQSDQYVKAALISQIQIMRNLHSENIVRFVDVLQTSNNYYIVQQFCNGGDLRSAIRAKKFFSQEIATQFLQSICIGFSELIANGIIHRDVKPQNILINNNKLKIADFGFAKTVMSRSFLNKTAVGTPLYMAPQVLKQQKYSSKCDIWALGLMFYEFLYGKIPWNGKSQYELVQNILKIPLSFPKEPIISQIAKNFISGCLKIQQANRFNWDEVYSHPIFGNKFKNFSNKNKKLENKAIYVINKLRLQIHSENIDLQKLFENLKFHNETSLKKQEFLELLKTLDQDIDAQQSEYVFNVVDKEQKGKIQFSEFKECLTRSGIRLKSLTPTVLIKKNTQQQNSEEQNKIIQVITKLRTKIEGHQLDLYKVYSSYDRNKNDYLNYQEFSKMISKIDNTLTQSQFKICFEKFDQNNDKKITFEEFYKTICKIAGQPSNYNWKKPQKKK